MQAQGVLFGQIAAVFGIVIAGVWSATQWTAATLGYQLRLGSPWFDFFGTPVYHPWRLFEWWFFFDAYAPHVFDIGGAIAGGSGLVAVVVAIAMSVWRSRQARLVTTYGSARWAEATGANMLFLVLGFLEFPDQRDSDKTFTAPLISVPVSLQKKEVAGIQQFSLQYTGDDISENLSLREKLRNDFGLVLPELGEEQIDVNGYFAEIQAIIKKQPGFALKHRVSLCLLSFSNMLLVRDLDPTKWPSNGDENSLIDHPIVREVFEGRADDGGAGLSLAEEHLVEEGPGASIPLVYDADSSQHSALIDVLSLKKNLVIEGPPGTGKSQTITNLIAACLAEGKKVLFVAEKLAALEVVKNRLSLAGLDPFVLELHSNKTNKKRVLEEIAKRTTFRPNHPNDLPRLQQQLEAHRQDLKAYTDLINSIAHNAFGLTLHQIMWRAEKHRQQSMPMKHLRYSLKSLMFYAQCSMGMTTPTSGRAVFESSRGQPTLSWG